MKRLSKPFWLATACTLALVPMLAAARAGEEKVAGHKLVAASEMKWVPLPEIKGAEQVLLWGDPAKGPHRAMYKFPVGLKAPLHTHTHGDRGLVVSGTLSMAAEGEAAKRLGPGSWFSIAGGTKHTTEVAGEVPCVFYIERDGPFDVVMAGEAPKKDEAPKK